MNSVKFNGKSFSPSKIVCVGKNYDKHIKEMGGKEKPKNPVIFLKPNSSVNYRPESVFIPNELGLLHHEVELCFLVGKSAKNIDPKDAPKFISGYGVGIDFTLRDLQKSFKEKGRPWELSKGFDNSAVFGEFTEIDGTKALNLEISLKVNGLERQKANTAEMMFSPNKVLSYVSTFMTLEPGDIFMCGTPEGVGEVKAGDKLDAVISKLQNLSFKVER